MHDTPKTAADLIQENEALQARLEAAEEALRAIQNGEVDALVIQGKDGEQIYTLEGADYTYRVMVENISEGVANLTEDGMILYGNQLLAHILGVPLETLLGSNLLRFISPADRPIFQGLLRKAKEGFSKGEMTLQCGDNSSLPAFFSMSGLENKGQRMISLVVTDLTEQKRSEEILAAEKMARSILEQASEAIFVCDRNGLITRASQAAFEMVQENPLFQPFELVFPLVVKEAGEDFSLGCVLQGRSYKGIETRFMRQTPSQPGRVQAVDLLLNAVPLRNEDLGILGCILSLTDISLLKDAERKIAAEKEWFSTTLASIGDAVISTDPWGNVAFINSVAKQLTGWTSSEASGLPISQVLPIINEQTRLPIENPVAKVMKTGRIVDLANHTALISKSGRIIPIEDSAAPIRDAEGNVLGVIIVFHDVTQKRKADTDLRESRDRLLLTTEAVEIGLWEWDVVSDTMSWDERCQSLFDIPQGIPLTYPVFIQAVHPEDRQGIDQAVQIALETRAIFKGEHRTLWSDESVHWVYSRAQAVYDDDGNPTKMVGVMMDITDRKVIEEEIRSNQSRIEVQHRLIEQREQERQQISRDLHDGPVQALIAATFALHSLRQENCAPEVAWQLESIQNSLHEQVNELRLYAGDLRPPILGKFGLGKAIESHLDTFQKKYPGIHIQYLGASSSQLQAQEVRLALFRIYQEAMANIVRHSQASQAVIRLEETEDTMVLEIQDDGIGFELPKDWLLLARKGHLGLVGMRERAEAIGGKVFIHTRPGSGTLLQVRAPLVSHSAEEG